ncbi:I78 family peptidase inhibitor [Croceibacterium aestuarii]|uniref:I78 family peptidase inhibitor n=1 Tax=Croceibacterium aestuarii TaxID=3064139 RepID=UPI00272E2C16|nr:I78 family peptidase inhibitor [Croceibacterium sp. D39]
MKVLAPLSVLALGALSACTTTDVRDAGGTCNLVKGQRFEGQKATTETGHNLLLATGAKTLRWVPPRTAVTMDFRPDRLTVSYDDDMVITKVSCS